MKRFSLALGALALATLCAQTSKADTFSFSFTGFSFNGAGTITATKEGNTNVYDVTGIPVQLRKFCTSFLPML